LKLTAVGYQTGLLLNHFSARKSLCDAGTYADKSMDSSWCEENSDRFYDVIEFVIGDGMHA